MLSYWLGLGSALLQRFQPLGSARGSHLWGSSVDGPGSTAS